MTVKKKAKRRVIRKLSKPVIQGWNSSDQDEIERRRYRGAAEACRIESVVDGNHFYNNHRIRGNSGGSYEVEIRSLNETINTCSCPDHTVNRLGTCKHIEAVLLKTAKGKKRRFQSAAAAGHPNIEIFLDRRDDKIKILWPQSAKSRSKLRDQLAPFFSIDGILQGDLSASFAVLQRKITGLPKVMRNKIRVSRQIEPWLIRYNHQAAQDKARQIFDQEIATGKRTLDVVNAPLYPYQRDGMLHLVFTERALLADDMGLGKTVQAIAACELLRRMQGVQRVLVISPASLKAEWQEQIEKFTQLDTLIIQGSRAARLKQYRQKSFFYLCNYEQILFDRDEIQSILAPDIIILDEAQRIKNWQTKTANAVKQLKSRYAFVLTGTPIENRIDEIYSIVQFLDPHLFGPLFRFNRDFYELDEKGQACGYKNLDKLHHRLHRVMLRRRKDDVEGELPGRTINNYFVSMTEEQTLRYDEINTRVARLMNMAQRRPLRKEEWEKLQKWLACLRMLCDSPYILDPKCDDSPKIEELENILRDLLDEGDHEIIIFSEWTRMLELVARLADKLNIDYAVHTGKINQKKRRQEIRRFKDDPDCILFLSSDAGSTGLNLQNADVVINLDLPWNPAKLEQRIARAWRKHQKRAVQVINLICENSIEHRMLHLLDQKQNLAQGVIDGRGDLKAMALPSGRAAFMERMETLMGQTTHTTASNNEPTKKQQDPLQRLREESVYHSGERLDLLQVHEHGSNQTVVAVVDHHDDALRNSLQQSVSDNLPGQSLEILDRDSYATIMRLINKGILSLNSPSQTLHQNSSIDKLNQKVKQQQLQKARKQLEQAERKNNMAQLLAGGGFINEAFPALCEAVEQGLKSLAILENHESKTMSIRFIENELINNTTLPSDTPAFVAQLREARDGIKEKEATTLLKKGSALLHVITEILNKAALHRK